MMRRALFAVLLLSAFACDSGDKPEFADGEQTKIYEGTFIATETTSRHDFILVQGGTLRIELTESNGTNSITGDQIENPTLIVSIGRPLQTEEGIEPGCNFTFSTLLAPTEAFTVFLDDTRYCLVMDSNATPPDDAKAIIEYIASVTAAFA